MKGFITSPVHASKESYNEEMLLSWVRVRDADEIK